MPDHDTSDTFDGDTFDGDTFDGDTFDDSAQAGAPSGTPAGMGVHAARPGRHRVRSVHAQKDPGGGGILVTIELVYPPGSGTVTDVARALRLAADLVDRGSDR
jgi:hypothetical protein